MTTAPTSHPDQPGWYTIRLQGHLEQHWAAHFEGMTLTADDGFTVLAGPVLDQSALHGLIQQLRDLGLPLDSVVRAAPSATTPPSRPTATSTTGA